MKAVVVDNEWEIARYLGKLLTDADVEVLVTIPLGVDSDVVIGELNEGWHRKKPPSFTKR